MQLLEIRGDKFTHTVEIPDTKLETISFGGKKYSLPEITHNNRSSLCNIFPLTLKYYNTILVNLYLISTIILVFVLCLDLSLFTTNKQGIFYEIIHCSFG